MYNFPLTLVLATLFLIFPGCVHHNVATSAEIESFSSGSLHVARHDDAPSTIYVDMGETQHGLSAKEVKDALLRSHFKLVDSPSQAGYILHISLLNSGRVDPGQLQKLVKAGYGSEAAFTGNGATGLLTDALLVQRRVPSATRPSHARLKNITKRNAIDSTQMRIGLLIPQEVAGGPAASALFADRLAEELHNALMGQSAQASPALKKGVDNLAEGD